ncbi:NlpC/P60 family protein [Streptomyces turgidiscabies]|uniref:NlpC/P60 family protein n=1 Tax=Streptomyces turgidiscabies (strain Car8) TaxID=698760 RepID=L7F9I3_STRT8|nr:MULTISPECIES: C40 family peptidase [Streptomyces]ELP67330.1 NlpC/P60 family protein [Streptomyces turgidiscabies Car8]MDX3492914.1 NlpC/P60 family protein [Streptomyces turgidiscabies]GAQ74286.1 putative endopeptidase precursor [Streptomyces turgidiscabies]
MGAGKRSLIATAVGLVCAVTVLGGAGTAFASPAPTPTPPPTPSVTLPPNKDLEAVHKKLEQLYHDAAVATDAYNAAEEQTERQSAEIVELAREIVKGQKRLAELKDRAGAAARSQYRSGGMPPEARLWLSGNPQAWLEGVDRIRQGQKATTGLLAEMARTQQDLELYARDASAQWTKLETSRKARAAAQKKIKQQIAAAEQLESQLQKKEKERLAELERAAAAKAQTSWLSSGILDDIDGSATAQGKKAVEFATAQIGKAYEWGAEGPDTFDCSGMTSAAWAAAGVPIPRTSQQQWAQLPHVDVKDMRPGDLIVYFDDASHIAMYIGDGKMVHAPRPGRTITIAGAGTMPILGVVRPSA